jgi:hypothetical protein
VFEKRNAEEDGEDGSPEGFYVVKANFTFDLIPIPVVPVEGIESDGDDRHDYEFRYSHFVEWSCGSRVHCGDHEE